MPAREACDYHSATIDAKPNAQAKKINRKKKNDLMVRWILNVFVVFDLSQVGVTVELRNIFGSGQDFFWENVT